MLLSKSFWVYFLGAFILIGCQPKKVAVEQLITSVENIPKVATLSVVKNETELQQLLSAQKGRVTLVNLWATWCKPCIHEMPALEKLHQNYQNKGVKIIALSLDELAKADSLVLPYWKSKGFSMDYYVIGTEDPSTIINKIDPLWLGVIPTSFLFNSEGEKIETITGSLNYEGFEKKVLATLNAN